MTYQKTYSDKFKQAAIQQLRAAGYPDVHGSLTAVADQLGVSRRTLRRWINGNAGAPPADPLITDLLDAEIREVLKALNPARANANYKELGTVLKILIDKQQVLSGAPTERTVLRVDDDGLSDEQRIQRVIELLDIARARRNRSPSGDLAEEHIADD